MEHLFSDWEHLKHVLLRNDLLICLDYDGTLTPIKPLPGLAKLSLKTKALLEELSKRPGVRLAVISGRGLIDIEKTVGVKGIVYSGNHGLTAKGQGINFRVKIPEKTAEALKCLEIPLREKLEKFNGVIVENKDPGITVHYRNANKKDFPNIRRVFRKITGAAGIKKLIAEQGGKRVLEVLPNVSWDKGKMVLWLLENKRGDKKMLPVYLGDDTTDEKAFRVLKNKGLTVLIGSPRMSYASYNLLDHIEAAEFLRRVSELKR